MVNIAIIDDDNIIVALLSEYLTQDAHIQVMFSNTNGIHFLNYLDEKGAQHGIDVVLLDLKMAEINGLQMIEALRERRESPKIIVLSSHYQDGTVGFMTKQGVAAFVPKGISPSELKNVIKHVASQGYYFSVQQMDNIRSNISSKAQQPLIDVDNELNEREVQVLKLLCQQKSAKEIGALLFLSPRTVEGYKSSLLLKVGVKNVTGLVIYALQKGISDLDELPLL